MQLSYGDRKQLTFPSAQEKFKTIGFLAASKYTSLHWEHNETSGAWGSEGRIHCYSELNKFPAALVERFSKGNGRILKRVNCNEFVKELFNTYQFKLGDSQDIQSIQAAIPSDYHKDFKLGLAI